MGGGISLTENYLKSFKASLANMHRWQMDGNEWQETGIIVPIQFIADGLISKRILIQEDRDPSSWGVGQGGQWQWYRRWLWRGGRRGGWERGGGGRRWIDCFTFWFLWLWILKIYAS